MQYLKRKHFSHRIQFHTGKVWFIWKKLKKSHFYFFFVKIFADLTFSIANFSNLCKKILKLSCSVLWKRFEIKSHQRRTRYLNPCRNGGRLLTGGGSRSPPYHINVVPRKMLKERVADFFFTFPKYVNGVLETTFCSQITFGLAGRGQKWSKLA